MKKNIFINIFICLMYALSSADSISCISYTTDTLVTIPIAQTIEEKRLIYGFLTPHQQFYCLDSNNIYICISSYRTLQKYNMQGQLLNKIYLDYQVHEITLWNNLLYVFDGEKVHIYNSLNLTELKKTIKVKLRKGEQAYCGLSFFYQNYLFIGDIEDRIKQRKGNDFSYVIDISTGKQSIKIKPTDLFIPVTNIKKEKVAELRKKVFGGFGSAISYCGQSEKHLIYVDIYHPPNTPASTTTATYYTLHKTTFVVNEICGIDRIVVPIGARSCFFLNDSTSIWQNVSIEPNGPVKLNFIRIKFQ